MSFRRRKDGIANDASSECLNSGPGSFILRLPSAGDQLRVDETATFPQINCADKKGFTFNIPKYLIKCWQPETLSFDINIKLDSLPEC